MKPVAPQLDSIKKAAHQQVLQILTPPQREKIESRRLDMQRRDSVEKARRDSGRATSKSTTTCR